MQVFPSIYNVTTFPLTCALEIIYGQVSDEWEEGKTPCPPVKVELISCIERSLNYGHTGNTKVIASALMNRLWVGLSLLRHGLPMFSPACSFAPNSVSIDVSRYPLHETTRVPYTASDRSQLIMFGPQQHLVSTFVAPLVLCTYFHNAYLVSSQLYKSKFAMHMLVLYPPDNTFPEIKNAAVRRAAIVAEYVVKGLISDLVMFVINATEAALTAANAQRDAARGEFKTTDYEILRRQAMTDWKARSSPFDHDSVSRFLARIVSPQGSAALGLPYQSAHHRTMNTLSVAKHLYKIAVDPNAPFRNTAVIRKGVAHSSLAPALTLMRGMVEGEGGEKKRKVEDLFCFVVRHCLIKHNVKALPWGLNKPSYDNWVSVRDGTHDVPIVDHDSLTTLEQDERTSALNAREAELADAAAPWSMADIPIGEIALYANRLVAPMDFDIGRSSVVNSWTIAVFDTFDIRDPVHRYCMFLAWIVSRMCPKVHWDSKVVADHFHALTTNISRADIMARVRSLNWQAPDGAKGTIGVKDSKTYWQEATVFMVGALCEESPVIKEAKKILPRDKQKGGKGQFKGIPKDWTQKYSASPSVASEC